jgi:hypothetical protein
MREQAFIFPSHKFGEHNEIRVNAWYTGYSVCNEYQIDLFNCFLEVRDV